MYDLAIIGGGVWGTAAALTAVEQVYGRVLLLESNPYVAGESSGKSGGIMSEFVGHPDDLEWTTRSHRLIEEAAQQSGDAGMLRRYGRLALCASAEVPQLDQVADRLRAQGQELEMLDRGQVKSRFPLIDGLAADTYAMWSPNAWHINPTAYAQATLTTARARGLEVHLAERVQSIHRDDGRIRLQTAQGSIDAAKVLVAAGTWTRKLIRTAGIDLPYRPYRVQLASLAFPNSEDLPIISELATDMYIVPDGPGNLLVGDGTQLWEHDPDAYKQAGDPEFERDITAGLARLVSAAGEAAQLRRSWAGLCGATPDRRPLIGPVAERLYVACGDNGSGVGRGPALGELGARIAMGLTQAPHLDPFRFPPDDFKLRPGSGFIVVD